ncbi:Phosphatidylglycerol/phosphatidylinositol transfer protein [Zancudomyces culisetae]|uniref:Phosphatidylglycerol/phosphatidylinositol transfer protein n=1 Tax=Zancudomyces culisetae TaxID=1213189 RepID=A0A1R1PQG3_ZANCU|nr:Phosphatidylglycerol/phosphatidylinositol transfer protein [Zancudomyces culisetae]OMH83112.1 Phosphatidylglycerol/phosphatidylinositol transfer protein [Zancudomyces culisetae]|eukprot:OMH79456.1 Phosphatidylglycerol/phosphatidylinositol transfer protein [Zancudomyces culisetae]
MRLLFVIFCLLVLSINQALAKIWQEKAKEYLSIVKGASLRSKQRVLADNEIPLNKVVVDLSGENDLMKIEELTLDPEYPQRGRNISVYARAYIKERIEKATARVVVKYGIIRLVNSDYDLCELLAENTEERCPLEPGLHEINVVAYVPAYVPPVSRSS